MANRAHEIVNFIVQTQSNLTRIPAINKDMTYSFLGLNEKIVFDVASDLCDDYDFEVNEEKLLACKTVGDLYKVLQGES